MAGYYNRGNDGREFFRLTDRIVRLLTTSTASGTGYADIPDSMGGTPFFYVMSPNTVDQNNGSYLTADAWLEGRRVRWSNQPPNTTILYGVY